MSESGAVSRREDYGGKGAERGAGVERERSGVRSGSWSGAKSESYRNRFKR